MLPAKVRSHNIRPTGPLVPFFFIKIWHNVLKKCQPFGGNDTTGTINISLLVQGDINVGHPRDHKTKLISCPKSGNMLQDGIFVSCPLGKGKMAGNRADLVD